MIICFLLKVVAKDFLICHNMTLHSVSWEQKRKEKSWEQKKKRKKLGTSKGPLETLIPRVRTRFSAKASKRLYVYVVPSLNPNFFEPKLIREMCTGVQTLVFKISN